MKKNSPQNNILQMIEMFIELELNVQAILNADLHFHLSLLFRCLYIAIIMKNCEIRFLRDGCLQISVHYCTDEVADPSSNTIECLVLFLEVGEFELETFVLSQDASWLKLFGEGMELSRQILITEYLQIAHQHHFNAQMLILLRVLQLHPYLPADIIIGRINRQFYLLALLITYFEIFLVGLAIELDVYCQGSFQPSKERCYHVLCYEGITIFRDTYFLMF